MWTISQLKDRARTLLNVNYWGLVLASFLLGICSGGGGGLNLSGLDWKSVVSNADPDTLPVLLTTFLLVVLIAMLIGVCVYLFLLTPLRIGCLRYFFVSHFRKPDFSELGTGFRKGSYSNVVAVETWRLTYLGLWYLLFIVPGIVKSYEYRMIPYLLAERPNLPKDEAFRLSRQMMDGEKWHAFCLDLSFIGWFLLAGLTCGLLGLFYVFPYYYLTDAGLFVALLPKKAATP